ncbi:MULTISPECIES: universal stress protein [Kordiimonas]|jgi:nucleotide-binding universal stress UspA family protein|uniref:Nucleotide-binding universal stress protein, UspA family n=1 Tax=Kordiimonas lacus TaxID=637679 RepID=A0A1G7DNC3_9PROT|nr:MULTISPECIES: universal stress protein [Kordiimonas]SDE53001.1 Nucleotide-binding universal stress protein, UspA family [Kordiimonas lacus]
MKKHKLYLVAVDGSEWGNRAADHAIQTAKLTGAKVQLVTVVPWSGYQPLTVEEIVNRPIEKEHEEQRAREEILDPVLARHKDSGVEISSELHWGHPVEVIRKQAKEEKAGQVFIGRRGRSRVADLILGSVANSLAHSLGVPIVLVP